MITSNNRTDLFYGSQRIRSRYLGDKLVWGDNLDVQSVSFSNKFFYYQYSGYGFYNYTAVELQLNATDAQLLQGKNIVSVEVEGKKSDIKWSFPTSGSSISKNYLVVETTSSTFKEVQNKAKSDYGITLGTFVNAVVYYTV